MPPPQPLPAAAWQHAEENGGAWRLAEQNAAAWMRWWGYPDAEVTNGGADGGIDVVAQNALGQVKYQSSQVTSSDIQRLFGARGSRNAHRALFFFTGFSYSKHAVAYADDEGIALFIYSFTGAMTPVNGPARLVVHAVEEREAALQRAREEAAAPRAKKEAPNGWRLRSGHAARDALWAAQEAELRAMPGPESARRAEAIRVTRDAAREAAWREDARQAAIQAEARRPMGR